MANEPDSAYAGKNVRVCNDCGGHCCGPTRKKDEGWRARTLDALLGRELLCGEVPQ
jgi:hypothetical protein